MNILRFNDVPRYFTLTINKANGFPCVVIDNNIMTNTNKLNANYIEALRKIVGLNEDICPFHDNLPLSYGFGDSLEVIETRPEETVWQINLPQILVRTDRRCPRCRGKKKENGHSCFSCHGTGKELEHHFERGYMVTATLSALFLFLNVFGEETKCSNSGKKQFLTINTVCDRGQQGSSLGGMFSPDFIRRLKTFGADHHFKEVDLAMCKVHNHMWQSNSKLYEPRCYTFQNLIGNLIVQVPGDACEIHPSPHVEEIEDGMGADWTCHNVDTPLQQLTLITGLASIFDLVENL